jgi:serine phosphatase RsbU (regulator of sigma subunit)
MDRGQSPPGGGIHPLLARQLRRLGIPDLSGVPSAEAWALALERISATYLQAEQDRYLLERSLDLSSQEMQELMRNLAAERDRLESDLRKVLNVQQSIHPKLRSAAGLQWAVRSAPLEQVTGDYFDVQLTPGGCWIGIGDVAGHGLTAGMLMIMLQSVIAALIKRSPEVLPADLLPTVNAVMFENIRDRLDLDDHATLTLLRWERHGVLHFAGAHEDIILLRGSEAACEALPTPGTWTGLARSVESITRSSSVGLDPGDLVVLYTDGVIDARDATGAPFGLAGLCAAVAAARARPVEEILAHAWQAMPHQPGGLRDDATLSVFRVV